MPSARVPAGIVGTPGRASTPIHADGGRVHGKGDRIGNGDDPPKLGARNRDGARSNRLPSHLSDDRSQVALS